MRKLDTHTKASWLQYRTQKKIIKRAQMVKKKPWSGARRRFKPGRGGSRLLTGSQRYRGRPNIRNIPRAKQKAASRNG